MTELLIGWGEIAVALRISVSTAKRLKKKLLAAGVLMYKPMPGGKKRVAVWEDRLKLLMEGKIK